MLRFRLVSQIPIQSETRSLQLYALILLTKVCVIKDIRIQINGLLW